MSNVSFCDQCGAQIKAGARFCAQCGAPAVLESGTRASELSQPPSARKVGRKALAIAATTIGVLVVIASGIGYAHYAGFLSLGFLRADVGEGEYLYVACENGMAGLIDASGHVAFPFTETTEMLGGCGAGPENDVPSTAVGPPYSITRNGESVYVNRNGQILFKGDLFQSVGRFKEGLAPARSADIQKFGFKYGFIDRRGKFVIPPQFDAASEFGEGLAAVLVEDGRWGYIDKTGKLVIAPRFQNGARSFQGGVAEVLEHDGVHLIDRNGNQIGTIRSEVDRSTDEGVRLTEIIGDSDETVSEGSWAVAVGKLWGFADTKGNWVIKPQYRRVGPFREGLAPAVPARGVQRFGFIDQTGTFVVPPRFEYAGEFGRGLARVRVGGKWGYVDKTGKTVIPFQYEHASPFVGEIARVIRAGTMSYIDTTGRVVWTAGAQNAGVALSPAASSKGAASSAQDRPASRIPPKISQQSVAEILGEIDTAVRSRNLDVLYARLGRNARIDVTLEGFGPTQTLSFNGDEYRAYAQQSFSQISQYEYRRNNTQISVAADGMSATVTAEVLETATGIGRTLTTISSEQATFGMEDGKIVITAIRAVTKRK